MKIDKPQGRERHLPEVVRRLRFTYVASNGVEGRNSLRYVFLATLSNDVLIKVDL